MSAHNFWNNLSYGFFNGMFNSNPFIGFNLGGWGGFSCFNSCFNSFFNCSQSFPSTNMYMYPNVMSTTSIFPVMSDMNVPSFDSIKIDVNKLFPTDNWQKPLDNNFLMGDVFEKSTNSSVSTSNNLGSNTSNTNRVSTISSSNHSGTISGSSGSRKLTDKYNGTAEDLNKELNRKNGVLKNKGNVFLQAQEKYGINAAILASICINESGYGTSNLARTKNNVGGVSRGKGFKSYTSVDECIMDIARFLKSGYVDKGLVTIAQVGAKYCPVGDPRDTKGTNSGWGAAVSKITDKILA